MAFRLSSKFLFMFCWTWIWISNISVTCLLFNEKKNRTKINFKNHEKIYISAPVFRISFFLIWWLWHHGCLLYFFSTSLITRPHIPHLVNPTITTESQLLLLRLPPSTYIHLPPYGFKHLHNNDYNIHILGSDLSPHSMLLYSAVHTSTRIPERHLELTIENWNVDLFSSTIKSLHLLWSSPFSHFLKQRMCM